MSVRIILARDQVFRDPFHIDPWIRIFVDLAQWTGFRSDLRNRSRNPDVIRVLLGIEVTIHPLAAHHEGVVARMAGDDHVSAGDELSA